ncbi:class I SAM-dependent methyltransferase [Cupriavidus sp. 2TAF22]
MAVDAGLERWVARVRKDADVPVRIKLWTGSAFDLGRFGNPKVTLSVRDSRALPYLVSPSLDSLGEAYVQGRIDVDGDITDIIHMGYRLAELGSDDGGTWDRLAQTVRRLGHSKDEDKAAIEYHYDVSNEFYSLWLDENMVYSCGYFEDGSETLHSAQLKKIDHILTKIRVQRGQTLLDIGCGWGALVIRAAQKYGAKCVGITLSENQYRFAKERVERLGLASSIEIRLQDYRDVAGTFDRITSVGMFEHVGLENLPRYFGKVASLLSEGGVVMNHGITSSDASSADSPHGGGGFIDKYVFPQGELPHISLALKAMQEGGIEALDIENLRRHYAQTLSMWTERFEEKAAEIREAIGEKKYRIWRVYLAGCAFAFDVDNVAIYQVVGQKARRNAGSIPWSRKYMYRKTE